MRSRQKRSLVGLRIHAEGSISATRLDLDHWMRSLPQHSRDGEGQLGVAADHTTWATQNDTSADSKVPCERPSQSWTKIYPDARNCRMSLLKGTNAGDMIAAAAMLSFGNGQVSVVRVGCWTVSMLRVDAISLGQVPSSVPSEITNIASRGICYRLIHTLYSIYA
jgi:hypothetical protein